MIAIGVIVIAEEIMVTAVGIIMIAMVKRAGVTMVHVALGVFVVLCEMW